MVGKTKRLYRIFNSSKPGIILAPLDDSLLAGPDGGLCDLEGKVVEIAAGRPNAIIAFPGLLEHYGEVLKDVPTIVNLTASTTVGLHTRKVQITDVEEAGRLGADAVAVHVNLTSRFEHEMLSILGQVSRRCSHLGMPLLAIMYPRREGSNGDDNFDDLRNSEPKKYAKLVSHAVRVGVELGADLIKTQYTGSAETFAEVVAAACKVPVFIAGGPLIKARLALIRAAEAVSAGASGVSFGRNVFNRHSNSMLTSLRLVLNGSCVDTAMAATSLED